MMPSPETQQTTSKPLSATLESHLATSKLHGQKLADAVENHLRSSWGSKSKSKRREEDEEEEEGAETASIPPTPTQITVQRAGLDQGGCVFPSRKDREDISICNDAHI